MSRSRTIVSLGIVLSISRDLIMIILVPLGAVVAIVGGFLLFFGVIPNKLSKLGGGWLDRRGYLFMLVIMALAGTYGVLMLLLARFLDILPRLWPP